MKKLTIAIAAATFIVAGAFAALNTPAERAHSHGLRELAKVVCPTCKGTGKTAPDSTATAKTCAACKGTGTIDDGK